MNEDIVRVENISKSFAGVRALDDVTLHVQKGEIVCLVGENGSGKSTLIKIIAGVYTPDRGDIIIDGRPYKKLTPIESIKEGVQVIYQDFSLFPNLSVAENLAINEQVSSGSKIVNWKNFNKIAAAGLAEINVSIDLDTMVGSLPTADRQLIAITKAIMAKAKIIIMDEPTTALTQKEIQSLFQIIQNLKKQNISTLFVSHKLNEVKDIADRTIILRNGSKVLDQEAKSLDIKTMEFYMTGRKLDSSDFKANPAIEGKEPILVVDKLSLKRKFKEVCFSLKPGEILGITGLLGSGRTELALALFGVLNADSGTITINGKQVVIKDIKDAIKNKIGYVPEDRIREGLSLEQSIEDNISVSTIDQLINRLHLIDEKAKTNLAKSWIERLNIKTPSGALPTKSLSGGNQQRVVLAKWLASEPNILILNSPTVGVDVGSKVEIQKLIHDLADEGMGILLISDDIPELMHTCDRILLMRNGKIFKEFKREEIDEEQLNNEMTEVV